MTFVTNIRCCYRYRGERFSAYVMLVWPNNVWIGRFLTDREALGCPQHEVKSSGISPSKI